MVCVCVSMCVCQYVCVCVCVFVCVHALCTVEPVYYGHLGTTQKCPDYQGVLIFQVSLLNNI